MTLKEMLQWADHNIRSQPCSDYIFWRESNPDREVRLTETRHVEVRYYPDKHGGWSKWYGFQGFDYEDVMADDWVDGA